MSELIHLPFTLFVHPGTSYEEFCNSEHVHPYEVYFSMSLKERNLMLQGINRFLIHSPFWISEYFCILVFTASPSPRCRYLWKMGQSRLLYNLYSRRSCRCS